MGAMLLAHAPRKALDGVCSAEQPPDRRATPVRSRKPLVSIRSCTQSIAPMGRSYGAAGDSSAWAHTHRKLNGQVARKASVTGRRAARRAGNRPPIRPMPNAHFSPVHSSSGETLNWNTTWLKLEPSVATL